MSYPKTGQEVYVSLNLSNTMLTGIGKGTITREEVSASYLKRLFAEHGVIVSAKPEQRRLLELVNERCELELEIPEQLKLFQLSEEHRRLVVIEVTGLRRKNKTRLAKNLRPDSLVSTVPAEFDVVEDNDFDIIRTKRFSVKPMTTDEAVLQMNLLGHSFYVFRNIDNNVICVVYHRNNGGYGLIETEE